MSPLPHNTPPFRAPISTRWRSLLYFTFISLIVYKNTIFLYARGSCLTIILLRKESVMTQAKATSIREGDVHQLYLSIWSYPYGNPAIILPLYINLMIQETRNNRMFALCSQPSHNQAAKRILVVQCKDASLSHWCW